MNEICGLCEERFVVAGFRHCSNCLVFVEEIDERDCPACGSALGLDGSCTCDLGPTGDPYWVDWRK